MGAAVGLGCAGDNGAMSSPATPSPAAAAAPVRPGWTAGWSLKLQINLLVTGLMALFVAVLLWLQIDAARSGVREEVVAANRVATQLLQRVSWVYASAGPNGLRNFLEQLGRVRANDITLEDDQGRVLFQSPRPTYKQGREAPQWYAQLILPPLQRQVIELPGGRLTVEADPSRAILDGWDDLLRLAAVGGVALLLLALAVYALLGRALRPWPTLVAGLGRLQAGDYAARLPVLPGFEAGLIGREVNRLAEAIEEQLDARMLAFEAQRRLQDSRELARHLEARTEEERRAIARLLHDEFAQSVTGMRSLARGLQDRLVALDPASAQAAGLISDEAARLYDAMQGLIPRLAPPALEELGLADALQALVDRSRGLHPRVQLDWAVAAEAPTLLPQLSPQGARALYALGQEGLTNALRHSQASRIELRLDVDSGVDSGAGGGAEGVLCLRVSDDGMGLQPQSPEREHHGLRGLRERLEGLGGRLELGSGLGGRGLGLTAVLPLPLTLSTDNAAMDSTEIRP